MLTKSDLGAIDTLLVKRLKPLEKRIGKVERLLKATIKFFDTLTINHAKRLKRIETHLELPQF